LQDFPYNLWPIELRAACSASEIDGLGFIALREFKLTDLVVVLAIAICTTSYIRAQPSVRAVLVEQGPRIDGDTSDAVWNLATRIDGFLQREPANGQPVSEETEVLVCYDLDRIYFAWRCHEPDPSLITAKELARDVSLGEDDRVQIILDTFLDGRNAYWYQVGPRGSIGDALLSENGFILNKEWDGLWEGRARIHAKGWDAEVAIPFKTMTFRPGQTTWGLKLIRHIRRKLESSYWPTANLDSTRFQVSDAGLLEGLEGITQGIGLDVAPYALTGLDQRGDHIEAVGDAGADVFYQLTPGLKSALTLNTDFAQTEVDARQINLTRFPLFFPEKRDFFLDGSNYFTFGPSGETLIPFFSRRIGLDPTGNPIPIIWGAKLNGQVGNWNMGFLNIMDDRATRNPNFMVARVRRNLGSQSSLGFITTWGNSLDDADNFVTGVDFKLASSKFRGNKNIGLSLFGLKSVTDGRRGNDAAFGAQFDYPNDFLQLTAGFHQIEENFRPGLGFVPRHDIRETYLKSQLGPRPGRWGILQVLFGLDADYITDLDNRLLTRQFQLRPLHLRFTTGEEVSFSVSPQFEHLDVPFAIHPHHTIPLGDYSFTRQSFTFFTAPRRRLWSSLTYRWGNFYNGSRQETTTAFGYKIGVPLFVGLELSRNTVTLDDGRFSTNVSRLSTNILFSPNVTLYSFLQYDNLSQNLGWQSRFRWILTPGNEILVVWNSRWFEPLERHELTESTARIKLRYNHRF